MLTGDQFAERMEILRTQHDASKYGPWKRFEDQMCDLYEAMQSDKLPVDWTIRQFQTNLPWTIKYSRDFRSNPQTHKDFAHALHHVSKAAGKLHELADDMDHDRDKALADLRQEYGKYVADLVVCALRIANTFPGGVIDLQQAVKDRIESKNGVKL